MDANELLSKLQENPKNPRTIIPDDFEKLKFKIRNFPQMLEKRPIAYDSSDNYITLGGNRRLNALQDLVKEGFAIKPEYFTDCAGWTPDQKRTFVILDNVSDGDWNYELLANEWTDLPLEEWGLDPTEWEKEKKEVKEDEPPAVNETEPAISQLGEVYQLGRHKLMCGDATKIEDVEKLMQGQKADMVFTDPPYGVSYGDKNKFLNAISPGNRIQENIDNDTKSVKEMKELWVSAFTNMNAVTKAGGSYYACSPQGGELMMMMMSLLESGWELKQSIIWVKNNHVLGRSDYHYKHEPILYGWKEGASHQYFGGSGQTTTWFIDRPNMSELHPTMKPIQLVAKAISNSSKGDDIILDLFLGSGSTLIASEQANRDCYGMELDPKYCDVIRKRYAKFIGRENDWQDIK